MTSKRTSDRYDFAVIGGGTAGLIASRLAAALGARVVLIERGRPGGDCLWTGCVPSKALIAAAHLAHQMRTARSVGLCRVEPEIDFAQVMAHVHGSRLTIEPKDSADSLRADGVEVIEGSARFVGPGRIDVDGTVVGYRSALIATGSGPVIPDLDGLDGADALTNETLWDITEQPGRLAILGGGPIGCELGQAFQRLGTQVTMVESADWVLSKEEQETQQLIAARLRADGVDLRLGATAMRVENKNTLVVDEGGLVERRIDFDRILVAAGRRPDTDGLGLESIGAQVDSRGAVKVDARLATTAKGVYAAGDATGALPFTHVAGYHGRTVVTNALFHAPSKVSYDAVPWVTFTDPEVGRVGLTEAQARERYGDKVAAVVYDYELSDRAVTAGDARGFAKLVGDPKGRLVGASVAAAHGGESIAELAAWVRVGAKIDDVSNTVHAYPTFTEGQARAADDYLMAKHLTPSVRKITKQLLALLRRSGRR
ncbi:MAG: FAD-dependent oxidoreductase [Actinomycetota bacterium]|nr:FAD-dependent oxidoreductase [Actinomycetota bacterium]